MESPKKSSNLKQRAIKGVIWSAIENWGRQAVSFGVFFLLARLLDPQTFGLVALASVFLAFLQVFLDQGFSTAIIQRQELEQEHLNTAFLTNLGFSILLTILTITGAEFFASFFREPQLIPIIRWLSLSFVFAGFSSVQYAILQRELAFKMLAVRSLIAVVISGAVGVFMAFLGYGVWSLVGQQLANGLAQAVSLWWVSSWRPKLRFSPKHFKDLFYFGINIVGGNLLGFFSRRSDDFLIGYFLGPVALGYYSIAYRLLLILIQLMSGVLNQIATPIFSMLQREPEKARDAYYQVTELTSFIAFPVFLGMAATAPELVQVVFGKQWAPSIPVMQILAFVGILQALFIFNISIITAMGKPSWNLWISLVNTLAQIFSFLISVKSGIVAVAAAYVIASYLLSFIRIWAVRKLVNIRLTIYLRQSIAPLACSLIMVAVIFTVKYFLVNLISIYALLAISILIGVVVYPLSLFLVKPTLVHKLIHLSRLAIPINNGEKK